MYRKNNSLMLHQEAAKQGIIESEVLCLFFVFIILTVKGGITNIGFF